jgi:hypothetical protein
MSEPADHQPEEPVGIRCPRCGCRHFWCVATRPVRGNRVRRYKRCRHCDRHVTTLEVMPADPAARPAAEKQLAGLADLGKLLARAEATGRVDPGLGLSVVVARLARWAQALVATLPARPGGGTRSGPPV